MPEAWIATIIERLKWKARRKRLVQQATRVEQQKEAEGVCPTCGSVSPWRCGC